MGSKKRNTRKMRGGIIGYAYGFPDCNNLSIFPITDENIFKFNRAIQSPMDCFINALELLGVITNITANIMRISTAGKTGFSQEEIEKVFILITGYNHDFKATTSSQEFSEWIATHLPPGNVVFAGYEGRIKHVYLIGRKIDGTIVYIDPQIGTICNLATEECQKHISNNKLFRLLFHSTIRLTPDQLRFIGFSV